MTNYHCFYHRQRGMSAPLWFWRNTNSAGTNNKTNKMKKKLLLLSCFLATWCGVQAGTPSGKINSARYYTDNSTISVNFTTINAYSAKLGLVSDHQGNSMYEPLCTSTYDLRNQNLSSGIVNVDPELEESPNFFVFLYLNGSKTPSGSQQVRVLPKGIIKGVNVDRNNKIFTVDYSMQHGSEFYSSLRIYDDAGTTLLYKEDIKKDPSDSNPNTYINAYRNFSLPYYYLNSRLEGGKNYRCRLYTNEKKLAEYRFYWPSDYINSIPKLEYLNNNMLKINFTVRDTGVIVGFKVSAASMSGNIGETKFYNYGRADKHEGTCEVYVPHYKGQVIYAVELFVNGRSVNGASLPIYIR